MTTTGGDDNLHSAVAITDSNGAPLGQEDTMNVPFRVVSMCNSFLIPIALEADVPGLSIEARLTSNSGGDVKLLGSDSIYFSQPVLNQRIVQDTMWIAYDPHHLVDRAAAKHSKLLELFQLVGNANGYYHVHSFGNDRAAAGLCRNLFANTRRHSSRWIRAPRLSSTPFPFHPAISSKFTIPNRCRIRYGLNKRFAFSSPSIR